MSTSSRYNSSLPTPITDIIWIQTSFIGDIVLTTAAMGALHDHNPKVRQHLVTTEAGAKALAGHPHLASIHVFSKRDGHLRPMLAVRRALSRLNLPKTTVILQPHRSLRSTLLSLSLGFPWYTYDETAGAFMAAASVPRVSVFHECDRISLLLEAIGIERSKFLGRKPYLPSTQPPSIASAMATHRHWIGLAPGSVWATKRWPTAKFASLAQLLLDFETTGIVLLGSKEDVTAANFIEEACLKRPGVSAQNLLNLAGQTSLSDLNGIYPRLTCLVANDSSPLHYASAYNIPTVAIFGPTTPEMGFAPLADYHRIAQVKLPCRPCSAHGPNTCPLGHFKCMNDLDVSAVLQLITPTITSLTK